VSTRPGLNAGRWDYIFSCIKKFKKNPDFCLANRAAITMEVPFMRSYALQLVKVCHSRGAPAMGGMSALIPIKNDPEANEKALAGIRHDKARDAKDGFDGGWVAHPGLVSIAAEEFQKVLGDRPNQWEKQRHEVFTAADFLDFQPSQPITEAGVRNNINVGIHYLGSWLDGQRLRADPQPDGRRSNRRDLTLAGLAVGGFPERRSRRWPQGHRRDGARHDRRGTGESESSGQRTGRRHRHLRPGGSDLRQDVAEHRSTPIS
jgi:hypothetical protein